MWPLKATCQAPGRRTGRLIAGALAVAAAAAGVQAQQRPTERREACTARGCHAGIVGRPVMHEPARAGRCLECHEYAVVEDHLFRLTAPRRELCGGCHELDLGLHVHEPVVSGDCGGCHDPHGSEHRALLTAAPGADLCAACHDPAEYDKAYVHGPVAIGACVVCHDAHSGSEAGLLRQAPKKLCLGCHTEVRPAGAAARHLHNPFEAGCSTCHDPHASERRFQLVAASAELCFTCHEGVANHTASAPVVHGPVTEGSGCVGCHDPHFTMLPRLQRKTQPDLCLDCHDRPVQTGYGRVLEDMAALLARNPNQHGPIREGACTACHQPHAAAHFSLLFEQYPPDFYAPFEMDRYALCFSCHLADVVRDRSGTGLTRFRDGDLNLHWLHVNREKGRTCRACHEVHASRQPFHIREAVPYGTSGWKLPINFEKTPDGGTCSPGCHKTKHYQRSAPSPSAEEATP